MPLSTFRRRLAGFLLVLALPASAVAQQVELPPVDEVFVLSAQATAPDRIEVRWRIAEGYYLYRHRTSVKADAAFAGASLSLPKGKAYRDEFFGDVETYRQQLVGTLDGTPAGASATLTVKYQGCADAGICYPPQTRALKVALPVAADAQDAAAGAGFGTRKGGLFAVGNADAGATDAAQLIELDREHRRVGQPGGARIEEGGFGKGAGLDAALAAARAMAPGAHIELDFGGQLAWTGRRAPVEVAVADPRDRSRAVLALTLDAAAGSLSTSGNSEHPTVVDGVRIGHLLDPRTGRPARDRSRDRGYGRRLQVDGTVRARGGGGSGADVALEPRTAGRSGAAADRSTGPARARQSRLRRAGSSPRP